MAAFDGEHEIARRGGVAAEDMHIGAELFADHASWILDAARLAEREADRQGMQHGAPVAGAARRAGLEHAMDVGLRHGAAAERDLGVEQLRAEPAAGGVDDDAFDLDAGHALGGVDGEPDRVFGRVHVDDGAALDAARALMPDAENAAAMRAAAQRFGTRRPD